MKRIRKAQATLNLPTLKLEGGLFLPDQLEKAAQGRASAQSEADYGTPKGVKLKDEYSRAFQIACAQWQHFAAQLERADVDAAQLTTAFVHELLRDAFGYAALQAASAQQVGELRYPVSLMAGTLPVLVAPHTLGLDEADARFAVQGGGNRKKAPFQAMQELLNASEALQWGIVSNGKQLRLLRDAASLTRPSFLEVDLADLLGGQRYAEFANVWRLLHASRAFRPGQGATACIWEQWRSEGQQEGTRVRDGLRNGVEQALLTLGAGFLQHPANHALRAALNDGTLSKDEYFQQLLRLIYRLIFVFTVEERGVLHPQEDSAEAQVARRVYAEGYALARLRELCLKRRARTRHDDQWQAIRIVIRGLAQGEPRLALPALGGLFAPEQCPDLDTASLDNAHLLTLEEASAYQQLLEDFDCTHEELARRIARSRPQISNTLRLLKLPPLVQRRVASGVLSAGHARALLGLTDAAAMERLAQRIVAEGLSVRSTEEIVALGDEPAEPEMRRRKREMPYSEALQRLSNRLADRYDTRVKVTMGARKGRITIEFAGQDDLERILATLAPGDAGLKEE